MALNTYTDTTRPRVRYGRPGGRPATARYEQAEHPAIVKGHGSHMPIDIDIHWDWRNPLNVIPASMVLLLLTAVVGMILGL
jgi:hypothetical protein